MVLSGSESTAFLDIFEKDYAGTLSRMQFAGQIIALCHKLYCNRVHSSSPFADQEEKPSLEGAAVPASFRNSPAPTPDIGTLCLC